MSYTNRLHPPTCVYALYWCVSTHPPVRTSCTNQSPPTHLCVRLVFTSHHPPTCAYVLYSPVTTHPPVRMSCIHQSPPTHLCVRLVLNQLLRPSVKQAYMGISSHHRLSQTQTACLPPTSRLGLGIKCMKSRYIIHVFQPYHAVFFWLPNQARHGKVDRAKVITHLS